MAWWQRQFARTTRGRVVALLRRGPRSVEELAEPLGISSAYSPVLSALLVELGATMSSRQLDALLRGADRRIAPTFPSPATFDERARASAAFLTGLGAEADLVHTSAGYEIRGHGCPLSEAVAACPTTCHAVEELLSEITSVSVMEKRDRDDQPRCHFFIPSPG